MTSKCGGYRHKWTIVVPRMRSSSIVVGAAHVLCPRRGMKSHGEHGVSSANSSISAGTRFAESQSQRLDVPLRRLPKESAVFAVELRETFISHFECGARDVKVVVKHPFPGHVQPQLFLVLQRAHRSK